MDAVEESRERRRDHQGACGVCYSIDLGGDLNDEKKQNINTLALDGRRLIILDTTTNQKQADAVEEIGVRRRDHQGAWGVAPPFWKQ